MKYFGISLLLLFSCCQKEPKAAVERFPQGNIAASNDEKPQLMGALRMKDYDNDGVADQVKVYDLKMEFDKDSIATRYYKIVFFKNEHVLYEYRGKIVGDPGDWEISPDVMNDKKGGVYDRRFIMVSNGYPACGYAHTHLLFYLGHDKISLFKEWQSMWDSGYGSDIEFSAVIANGKVTGVSMVNVSIDVPANGNEEMLEITHSDSIFYELKNNRWVAKNPIPTQSARKKLMKFDAYYNNN